MQRIFFILFILSNSINAQNLRGKVVAVSNNQPVPSASVFLSNTSTGTVTNEHGEFVITNFPQGKFDLVVSCIGYETYVQQIQSSQLPSSLIIQLKPKAKELDEVIIEPAENGDWQKWGNTFIENFIGKSSLAANCIIKNKEVIRFKFYRKKNTLKAFADEPLQIENKALGYNLQFQLEGFDMNFSQHYVYYYGFPLFKEITAKREGQQRRWISRRQEAYEGSLLHFMRSLYRNKLLEDGFEIRRMYKKPNTEKQRVKLAMRKNMNISSSGAIVIGHTDSSNYYNNILSQPDEISYLVKTILPSDSIAFAIDSTTAGVEFNDYIDVIYLHKKEPLEYLQQTGNGGRKAANIVSQITLMNQKHIEVFSNGSYYNPVNLMSIGYWSWSEKIATMLPFDYKPLKKPQP